MKNCLLASILFFVVFHVKASEEEPIIDNGDSEQVCEADNEDIIILKLGDSQYELLSDSLNTLPEDCPLRAMIQSEIPGVKKESAACFIIQEDPEIFEKILSWLSTGHVEFSNVEEALQIRKLADKWVYSMIPVIDRYLCLNLKTHEAEFRKLDSNSDSYFVCRQLDGLVVGLEDHSCCNKKMMEGAMDARKPINGLQVRNFILMAIPCGQHFSYKHDVEKCMSKIFNLYSRKPVGGTCSFEQAISQINNATPPYICAPVGEQFGIFNMMDGEKVSKQLFENPTSCLLHIYKNYSKDIELSEI